MTRTICHTPPELVNATPAVSLASRCRSCGHPESEHENGRCLHLNVDGGYHTDTICSCLGEING